MLLTQIVPMNLALTAEEIATQLRLSCKLLIKTRIGALFELAKEIFKAAWILENRRESDMDLSGYDYGDFFDEVEKVLNAPN